MSPSKTTGRMAPSAPSASQSGKPNCGKLAIIVLGVLRTLSRESRWSLIELAEGRILKVRSCLSRFMQTGDRYDANKIKCETGLGFSRDESFKSVWSHFGSQQPQSGLIWTCKALLRLKGFDDFK